ncbi:hypothetical protein FRC03_003974 [Tulasnella sp. 419]|nr:hypothetical protein FRC03_003974 [Tulasnella sp. 419]
MAQDGNAPYFHTSFPFGGSGSSLQWPVLLSTGIATLVATLVAGGSIWLQLKNYRKPVLQR